MLRTRARIAGVAAALTATAGLAAVPTTQAAPANDHFASAEDLGTGATAFVTDGSNVEATKEALEPNHAGDPGGASVWYRWTAPSTTSIRISACDSDFDTLLAVYTGTSLASLTPVVSNDQACTNQSKVSFTAVAGTTYRIAVDGYSNGGTGHADQGQIQLYLGPPSAPFNDDFSDASDLGTSTDISITGSNRDATQEAGEPDHAGDAGGASAWYSWTSLALGRVKVSTCGSNFDTLLAVYTGSSVDSLTPVASNDQACGNQSKVAFDVLPGVTYRIAVDGWSADGEILPDEGTIELSLRPANPPANDNFANAQDLGSVTSTKVLVSNVDATKETGEPNHAGDPGGASVWYRWTAPSSGPVRLDTCDTSTGFNTLLAVYDGSSVNSLTERSSSDNACAFGLSRAVFLATAGTSYRIAVDGSSLGGGQAAREGFVDLNLKVLDPPPNDGFADAQSLGAASAASTSGTNVDATQEEGEPWPYIDDFDHEYDDPGGASVWYRWTAPTSGWFTVDLCGSDFNTLLAVFTGSSVGALSRVQDNDNGCSGPIGESRLSFQATADTTYRIMVDGLTYGYFQPPDEGNFGMRIYPTTGIPPFPASTPSQGTFTPTQPATSQGKKQKRCRKGLKRRKVRGKGKKVRGKAKCVKKGKKRRKARK